MQKNFTYSIKTMGCKANLYDSLVLEQELGEIGGVRDENAPDVFVLNTCTVTDGADKKCSYELKTAKKKLPGAFRLVTGCFAQVAEEKIRETGLADEIVNNENKGSLKKVIASKFGIEVADDKEDIYWGQLPVYAGKVRAFVKIQDGCDDRCTYCIIPYARGASRSVKMGMILAEIQRLADAGVNEAVLTGVNIADYGKEWGMTLEDLIEAILAHTKIPRVRLTSLDPTEITDRLLAMIEPGGRLMPHLHVSLQSPVSRVLRAMKRDYRQDEVISCLKKIYAKSAEIFVGMDVITGFPGETLDEHKEAIKVLSELPWTRLHVFPYSEREGTPALKIPGSVPMQERKRRAQEFMALSHVRHEEFSKRALGGTLHGILFETPNEVAGDWFVGGHAPNYSRVLVRVPSRKKEDAEALMNTLGSVRILGLSPKPEQDWTLEASLCQ